MGLLGARPGHGKTSRGMELAAFANDINRKAVFFSLEYNDTDIADRVDALGLGRQFKSVVVDTSDDICAQSIMDRLLKLNANSLAVVDYLQLLDQKRTHPSVNDQLVSLRQFSRKTGSIILMISQIHRSFDLNAKHMPDVSDIRMPNPFDMSLFDKKCFLHEGEIQINA